MVLTALVLIIHDWFEVRVFNFNSIKNSATFFRKEIIPEQKLNDSVEKGCFAEWSLLRNDVYFRHNMAFYYTDQNIIRLYFDRNKQFKLEPSSLSLQVNVEFFELNAKIFKSQTYSLSNLNQVTINEHAEHSFGYIDAEIYVDKLYAFDNIHRAEVIVLSKMDANRTSPHTHINTHTHTELITLNVRPYRVENNDSVKNYSMLCSKLYRFFSKEQMNEFKFWIEMNRLNGYQKLVIYNNSIQYNHELNRMFDENKDLVEVIQFKCLPNFLDANNTGNSFITSFDEIKDVYKKDVLAYTDHFETIVFNECYLNNKNNYKYIAVSDQDEITMPRYFNLTHFHNKIPDEKLDSKCFYSGLKSNETSNIQFYLESHKKAKNLTKQDITFHFNMGVYLKQQTIDIFFLQLEKSLINSSISNDSDNKIFNVKDTSDTNSNNEIVDFNVTINNRDELIYAQYLLNLYLTVIKPFYAQNRVSLAKNVPENFNRFFFLLGPSTTWFCGKTIHNTLLTHSLSTHYPEPMEGLEWMAIEEGHVSHFRKAYNLNWKDKSILEFKFDINYFLCYFKPVVKKLNFNLTFKDLK